MKKNSRVARAARPEGLARLGGAWLLTASVAMLAVAGAIWWARQLPAGRPAASGSPALAGAPRLSADKPKIDLGDVRLGQTVQASFEITNIGGQTLRMAQAPAIEVVEGC